MSPVVSCGGVPDLWFEDTKVGRMFKEVWEANDAQIDAWLAGYGIPTPCGWARPGTYIQTTIRGEMEKERRKNDIVLIPVGCTENHGRHTVSAMDTLFCSHLCEAVRRKTAESGAPVSLALPPLMYGGHPYHHIGMPGTVILREEVVEEALIDVMLGLWNDGFRKQIIVNNHGHLWMLETALHKFIKRYQLPGVFKVVEWHRSVKHFFRTTEQGGPWETSTVHADEMETSVGLLLFPEMVDMKYAVDTETKPYLPGGYIDNAIEGYDRPSRWSENEGHVAIELFGTPEGVVGKPTASDPKKAKRSVVAFLRYLTMVCDDILATFPAGAVPPVEQFTFRTAKDMEPFLREPLSPGWKPVHALPYIGQH
jgi:creatinine amidohydrolase/Fe(II)-dependent formamide hydrolase-like protein